MNLPLREAVMSPNIKSRPDDAPEYAIQAFHANRLPYMRRDEDKNLIWLLENKAADLLETGCLIARLRDEFLEEQGKLDLPDPSVTSSTTAKLVFQRDEQRQKVEKLSITNQALVNENERLKAELEKASKALSDSSEAHKKELAAAKEEAQKEKESYLQEYLDSEAAREDAKKKNEEYLQAFLRSDAFGRSALFACNGMFKKAIYLLYKDFEKGYPVLPEEVGVRDYTAEEVMIPSDYLASCHWDEEKDRLVNPEGEPVQVTLSRRSFPPAGFRNPFPAEMWPEGFPRPPPGSVAKASASRVQPPPTGNR
jgi:hypothetical protein